MPLIPAVSILAAAIGSAHKRTLWFCLDLYTVRLYPWAASLQDTPAIAEHLPAGATAPVEGAEARSFAAVAVGGRQHKVTEGDVLVLDRLPGLEVGQTTEWDQVLLIGSATKTVIGRPIVPDAVVKVAVEQQTYAAKLPIFKKRRRKGYQRFNTFRRPITVVRVESISCSLLA